MTNTFKQPKTCFERSEEGQFAFSLPKEDSSWVNIFPEEHPQRIEPLNLPELSELNLTRHFNALAERNVGIDNLFYPLGSCTMKLNPRACEEVASYLPFQKAHPMAPEAQVQGHLEVTYELLKMLTEITGMDGGTLTPNAGAQGEFVGIQMIKSYHLERKDEKRCEIVIPDTAHGTNAASAALCGYRVITIPSDEKGDLSLDHLREKLSSKTAALMFTNPTTLGLFSENLIKIEELVHGVGGLLYYDGANLNPILGVVRPGDMGFDCMHLNLHKTFSTPHGGGGPGSGPVLCKKQLIPYLPSPFVYKTKDGYATRWSSEKGIGPIAAFRGNFAIYLRSFLYIKLHGSFGLRKVADMATLNANYLKHQIKDLLSIPFKDFCMHEFVVEADRFLSSGIRALDIAKRLLDYGVHAPTIYFPNLIKECLLIEPTECESKETLDAFVAILQKIVKEAEVTPDLLKTAPHETPVARLDETLAAKTLTLTSS